MNRLIARLRLYLVTDPHLCAGPGVEETVRQAVSAGVTMVQLRDKDSTTELRVAKAQALKEVLRGTDVPLVINDDVEAARIAGVDGVHIGQGDVSPAEARALLGPDRILGLSCGSLDEVNAADPALVDYLGLGPVFGTTTKPDHGLPFGLDGLARLVTQSVLPTVAIGGLKAEHHQAVLQCGADGSAIVSAICGQPDILAATRAFAESEKRP
ncbi:MAG: thiamine phosphate synthase [Gammaproteobacteria bacterium]|nr:MAG: thiamine phosphate synthase [Gammaproteobacteria bacterium]